MSGDFWKEIVRPRVLALEGGLNIIKYGEFVDPKKVDIWLQENAEWIKGKLPTIPHTEIEMKILDEDSVLSGRTRIEKRQDVKVKITIFVSKNVLTRKNIQPAIKAVLIHEFCHVVSPLYPDKAMEIHFPQVWRVWKKAQESESLACDVRIVEGENNR